MPNGRGKESEAAQWAIGTEVLISDPGSRAWMDTINREIAPVQHRLFLDLHGGVI
jgi:hypothetical protein